MSLSPDTYTSFQKSHTPRRETLGSFSFFVLVVLLVRSLLVSPFRIPSGSMIPTLLVGDFLVASKISYGWSRFSLFGGGWINYFPGKIMELSFPKRGDILVFACPYNTSQDWIKRVVAVPGDVVEMKEGRLHLNGQKIPLTKEKENYKAHDSERSIEGTVYKAEIPREEGKTYQYTVLKQEPFGQGGLDTMPPIRIEPDHVFCMGDNWDGSDDSRHLDKLGPVSKKYFLGPALFVWFSLDHQDISLMKPWTWLLLPFKIRFSRIPHVIR